MAISVDGSTVARWTGTPANGVDTTSAAFTPPGGSSMTVSVQRTAGSGGTNTITAKLYIVTGADTTNVGTTGSGSSTTNAITPNLYVSTANNSRAFYCGTDWNANGAPTSTDTEDAFDNGNISALSVFKAADTATSGTTVVGSLDAGGTGAATWNWAALEILAGAGTKLVCCVNADNGATGDITVAVSGGGLTWTQRIERDRTTSSLDGHASIWTADVVGGAASNAPRAGFQQMMMNNN